MQWIKRNLSLAISGALALVLVGFGAYYLFSGKSLNAQMETDLEDMQRKLDRFYTAPTFPSESNIATARAELAKLQAAIDESMRFFEPVPFEPVTDQAFKSQLDDAISELTQKARQSGIELPSDPYFFSFEAQKKKFKLDSDSFPAINRQLAEVRAICNLLFEAKIHSLTGLKRVRLTTDDPPGSSDYRPEWQFETNQVTGAVVTPYEVTFHCFSADLAMVLEGFLKSPHGLIVRAIGVDSAPKPPAPAMGVPRAGLPTFPRGQRPVAAQPVTENQTILNEERFQVTLWIAVVKPPSS